MRSDTIDIAGVLNPGGSSLGSTGYLVPGKGKTAPASFPASSTVNGQNVVVTLTGPCTGGCDLQPSTGTASLSAAPTLTDASGNPLTRMSLSYGTPSPFL